MARRGVHQDKPARRASERKRTTAPTAASQEAREDVEGLRVHGMDARTAAIRDSFVKRRCEADRQQTRPAESPPPPLRFPRAPALGLAMGPRPPRGKWQGRGRSLRLVLWPSVQTAAAPPAGSICVRTQHTSTASARRTEPGQWTLRTRGGMRGLTSSTSTPSRSQSEPAAAGSPPKRPTGSG